MNKTDLINEIAQHADLTKKDAGMAVDVLFETVAEALGRGEEVALFGFGTFAVKERAARNGRNPQTGEAMFVPASQRIVFKPGKLLKDAVNA